MKSSQVDIIVTTYNRVELLKRAMTSFFAHTDLELIGKIIISNDGSTDATAAYLETLRQQFPRKIVILPNQTEQLGLIPRFNEAFALCTANIICEFQDDVEFSPYWLENQLGHLDIAHFVTGFDAPEHRAFAEDQGYKIKHSSRFTQLLARREVWSKWFPMKPEHPFPTPTFKEGRHIGSNIDTNLYYRRKNRRDGKTKFLVLPGQIDHNAEHKDSTWRDSTWQTGIGAKSYTGGLKPEEVKGYWKARSMRQGAIAVGFAGRPKPEQEEILKIKKDFILPATDLTLRTIDYGCGVGHFSKYFDKDKYFGCDITEDFLWAATERNPGYKYACLDKPYFDIDFWPFEQFFTTNVLQHNSNQVVDNVFINLKKLKRNDFVFSLYENSHKHTSTNHMCFRQPEEYIAMIKKYFKVKKSNITRHVVHGEEHSLIKVYV